MHILLTDILTCPRCGPGFGLIVLADRMDDRRIVAGSLGCANCRARYLIEDGVAHLRRPDLPALEVGETSGGPPEDDRAFRVAAATGTQPPGSFVLLISSNGALAGGIGSLLSGARLVSVTPTDTDEFAEVDSAEGGSTGGVIAGSALPFRSGTFRAAAIVGVVSATVLVEARRVLAPGARIVVDLGADDTAERLRELGFEVHLDQAGTVVAAAPGVG